MAYSDRDYSSGEEEMFCIIEILHSKEGDFQNPFQGHMYTKYMESSAQNDAFLKQASRGYFSSAHHACSHSNQSLLFGCLQYHDSLGNDDSVSHIHQPLLFKTRKL